MKNLLSVRKLYDESSKLSEEYKKVIWGSKKSMINRHKLFFKIIKKNNFNSWLDIGSGTGAIFEMSEKKRVLINYKVGIEFNKKLFEFSKKKKFKHRIKFLNKNFLNYKSSKKFDLVSAIGVMQNCGYSYKKFLSHINKVTKKKSFLFITSKNLLFKNNNKNLIKRYNHLWFNPFIIKNFLENLQFKIINFSGFVPELNKVVKIENSTTFFIYAQKK